MKIETLKDGISVTIIGEKAFEEIEAYYDVSVIMEDTRVEIPETISINRLFNTIKTLETADSLETAVNNSDILKRCFIPLLLDGEEEAILKLAETLSVLADFQMRSLMDIEHNHDISKYEIMNYICIISSFISIKELKQAIEEENTYKYLFKVSLDDLQ